MTIRKHVRVGRTAVRGKQLNSHIMSLEHIVSAVAGSLLQTSTRTQNIPNVPSTLAGV